MKLRKILPALFAVLIVAFSALLIASLNDKPTVIYPGKELLSRQATGARER